MRISHFQNLNEKIQSLIKYPRVVWIFIYIDIHIYIYVVNAAQTEKQKKEKSAHSKLCSPLKEDYYIVTEMFPDSKLHCYFILCLSNLSKYILGMINCIRLKYTMKLALTDAHTHETTNTLKKQNISMNFK